MISGDEVRAYYSMPEGEIPVTPYERNKVSDLSGRVRDMYGGKKSSDLHIIAGRKLEQVRRIACLTALDLLSSGSEVIPFRWDSGPVEIGAGDGPVFLIDEARLLESDSTEGERKTVRDAVDSVRGMNRSNHAIILTLSQETYERSFLEMAESGTPSREPVSSVRGKDRHGKARKEESALPAPAAAFLPASAAFILSPLITTNVDQNPGGLGIQYVELIALALVALSAVSMISFAIFASRTKGKERSLTIAGLLLFLLQIAISYTLGFMGAFSNVIYPANHFTAVFLESQLVYFILFQTMAALSFCLMGLPGSKGIYRIGLYAAFALSEILIVSLVYVSTYITYLPHTDISSLAQYIPPIFSPPYSTLYFGFLYHLPFSGILLTPSFAVPWLFAAMYALIYLNGRKARTDETSKFTAPD